MTAEQRPGWHVIASMPREHKLLADLLYEIAGEHGLTTEAERREHEHNTALEQAA